jgi:beta-mannosidase
MFAYETFPIQKLQWEVGYSKGPSETPDIFVPANVPGAVQLDWAQAHGWDSYLYGDNASQYGWMEDVYWVYRSKLDDLPAMDPGKRLFLVCGGVDYQCEVRLGGLVLHAQEGMFTPFEIDLTGRVQVGDFLEIVVFPAPKSVPAPSERIQANQSCKPAVSYGWDFHPRLIPLGIWGACGWQIRPANYVTHFETSYELAPDLSEAKITVEIDLAHSKAVSLHWTFKDTAGEVIFDRNPDGKQGAIRINESLENPVLWWPNGQGQPTLYKSELALRNETGEVLQAYRQKVGIRRIRLIMHQNAWTEPAAYPKTRSTPPITLEVNGRAIFGKGSNWVSPHIFPGMVTEEVCRDLLLLVKNANMNLLRCWGGAIVQKEYFFELCDELGIMVWQEFPLACNRYEGTPEYLRILDQESRSIIRRLRSHPSLVLWCGGNELFNGWSGMTDQDLAIRLLNRNCFDLDPGRPFLATAPLMGMAHGSYSFKGPDGQEVFERFIHSQYTAYSEFGVVAHGPVEFIRRYLPLGDQQPDLAP